MTKLTFKNFQIFLIEQKLSNQILWIKKANFKLKISIFVMTRIYQIKFNCQTNTYFFSNILWAYKDYQIKFI